MLYMKRKTPPISTEEDLHPGLAIKMPHKLKQEVLKSINFLNKEIDLNNSVVKFSFKFSLFSKTAHSTVIS